MTSEQEIMDRVRDIVRRASTLQDLEGEFDVTYVLVNVRAALANRDLSEAAAILERAEATLDSIGTGVRARVPSGQTSFRTKFARARQQWLLAIRSHTFTADLCALVAVAALWAVVLAWIQIQSYSSFRVLDDISVFNQVLYSTSHAHALLYYTKNLPGGNNGQFFSVHFTPLIFTLVPIYYFFPGIPTLLIIKQVALALGALPAYGLARAKLGSRAWGWLLAGVYLATPLITGIDWANFDMESFIPVTLLATFYFFEARRLQWFMVSSVAALSVIESVAPLLALFAFVVFIGTLVPFSERNFAKNRTLRKFAAWALAASVASLGVSYYFLTVVFRSPGGGSLGSGFSESFSVLGATSIPDIPVQILLHPSDALAAIEYDGNAKLLYVVLLLGCLAFLPLLGELKYLLPALAWICGISLLSNAELYYSLSSHTLAYAAPFLIVGAITGARRAQAFGPRFFGRLGFLGRPRARWKPRWNPYVAGSVLAAGLLVTVAVASPWNSSPLGVPSGYPSGFDVPTSQDTDLSRVLALLPPSGSVLTTSIIFAAVSDRKAAFYEPAAGIPFTLNWTNYDASTGGALAFQRVTEWYLSMSQYVVLDYQLDLSNALAVLYFGNNLTGYGVVAEVGGAVLYERGWASAPELWLPGQTVLATRQSATNSSVFTTKAYHGLPLGEYTASFWWDDNATAGGSSLKVAVKEVPVAVDPKVKFETATAVKYTLDLNLTGEATTNRTSLPANESVQLQLDFAESLTFTITETQPIESTLFAVVIAQAMP